MGLAQLAKTTKLRGAVAVTFANGTTRTFKSEAEAEAATAGLALEHRRGAFFEVAKVTAPPAEKQAPPAKPKAALAPK